MGGVRAVVRSRIKGSSPTGNRRTGRLRVLTMVDGLLGGGESVAWQVAQHLDPDRFASTVCVTRWRPSPADDEIRARLEASRIGFIGLKRASRFDLRPWRSLVAEMRARRVDILHTHKFGSNVWGAVIAPRVPVPVFVAHEHTWSWEGNTHRRLLDRYLVARRAGAVVAVSADDRRRMTSVEGIPAEKTRFIPNGIPGREKHRPTSAARLELGIHSDEPVIGMVASLRPQKAYDVLIGAAGQLRDEFPGIRVLIVGGDDTGGKLREELMALARELHLEETVIFLGLRHDVFDVIDSFDVAVLSSDYEGSPIVVMEYMEAAKPVVATRVGGVPDLVVDGETGILVEPQSPGALAAAISSLLRDPRRARAMGEAAQKRRRREFSVEATAFKVGALYEELYEIACARGAEFSAGRGSG